MVHSQAPPNSPQRTDNVALLFIKASHRLCLQMELVLLGFVHTLQVPQLFFLKHPSHAPHLFLLVRFFLRGEEHSDLGRGLSLGGGGEHGDSTLGDSSGPAGLTILAGTLAWLACLATDGRLVFWGHPGSTAGEKHGKTPDEAIATCGNTELRTPSRSQLQLTSWTYLFMPTTSKRLIANSQVQNSQRLIVEAGHNCDYIIRPCAHAQVICFVHGCM